MHFVEILIRAILKDCRRAKGVRGRKGGGKEKGVTPLFWDAFNIVASMCSVKYLACAAAYFLPW
jgi:hypothetical protein